MRKRDNTLGRFDGNPFTDPLVKPEGVYAYYAPSEGARALARSAQTVSSNRAHQTTHSIPDPFARA